MSASDDRPASEAEIASSLETLIASGDEANDATVAKVRLLSRAAEILHDHALTRYGGNPGLMDGPEQSIAAAFQSGAGVDFYQSHFHKAAAMWRGITGDGTAFNDGNKRTGFMLASYDLARAGWLSPLTPIPEAEVRDYGFAIAERTITDVDEIANQLQQWWLTWPDD
jgi:prophage maintenance system killer protein